MKKLVWLCLLVAGVAHAKSEQSCQIVDETAETFIQLHQSGFSLDEIEIQPEALSAKEARLLKAMIEDAKDSPRVESGIARQKLIDDFKNKWLQRCHDSENNKEIKVS